MIGLPLVLAAASLVSAALTPYMHPQQLVDVGGRRVNLYCTGSGSPTVILDTDGDDSTVDWRFVQPIVAKRTRVCSYDAPSLGFSDPAPAPNDAGAMANGLHALVTRAGIRTPIVLVGYSLSGLSDRLFADRYRSELAGMVLVDPMVAYQHKRIVQVAPAWAKPFAEIPSYDRACLRAATQGTLKPGRPVFAQCMYTPRGPALPKPLATLITRGWEQPSRWQDFTFADLAADTSSSAQVVREQHPYGALPLIVLTSDMSVNLAFAPIPATQKAALTRAWTQWHRRIAALSSRGTQFVVTGSSSSISTDRPSTIVSAIDEVVDQVRSGK